MPYDSALSQLTFRQALGDAARGRSGAAREVVVAIEPFEVLALRYAHLGNRHPGENFILADPHEFASDLDYFVWVLRRSDCSYLIDTGFAQGAATRRGRDLLRNPASALKLIDMDSDRITDVI